METANEKPVTQIQTGEQTFNVDFSFDDFDQFLGEIENQLSPWHILEELDDTLVQVQNDMKSYDAEITSSDKDAKRKLAKTALESYNLNLLAKDDDFNVRTLALCNKAISPAVLEQAVEQAEDDKFTLMIIAHNPSATSDTLRKIFNLAGDEREVRNAIASNPNCSETLKFEITGKRDQAPLSDE